MILDTTSKSIEVVLSSVPVANQAQISASYADNDGTTFVPGENDLASNGTTAVTAVAAPASGKQRQLKFLSVFNADTSSITVIVRLNNGGTIRNSVSYTLSTLQTLQYTPAQGFYVSQTNLANGVSPGYIDGLKMIWVSSTAISFSPGAAYIQGLSSVLNLNSQFNLTSLVLTASTMYHAYLFLSSGVPTVEVVTTSPSSFYFGTARSKLGDPSRRYIGSFRTMAAGAIVKFLHSPQSGGFFYKTDLNNNVALSTGTSTSIANVSLSSYLPISSQEAYGIFENTSNQLVKIGSSDTDVTGAILFFLRAVDQVVTSRISTDSSQSIQYQMNASPASGGLNIWIGGFTFER